MPSGFSCCRNQRSNRLCEAVAELLVGQQGSNSSIRMIPKCHLLDHTDHNSTAFSIATGVSMGSFTVMKEAADALAVVVVRFITFWG